MERKCWNLWQCMQIMIYVKIHDIFVSWFIFCWTNKRPLEKDSSSSISSACHPRLICAHGSPSETGHGFSVAATNNTDVLSSQSVGWKSDTGLNRLKSRYQRSHSFRGICFCAFSSFWRLPALPGSRPVPPSVSQSAKVSWIVFTSHRSDPFLCLLPLPRTFITILIPSDNPGSFANFLIIWLITLVPSATLIPLCHVG